MQTEISTSEAVELLGITRKTLATWHHEGCPRVAVGRWSLPDVLAWLRKRETAGPGLTMAKQQYWSARARREELRAQGEEGALIRTAEAQRVWSAIISTFKNRLEMAPKKLAPLLCGMSVAEIAGALEKEVFLILTELSEPDLGELARKISAQEKADARKPKPRKRKAKRKA